jgi:Domain of unknown function (DUF4157)
MHTRLLAIGLAGLLAGGCAAPHADRPLDTGVPAPAAVEWAFDVRAALAPAHLRENASELDVLNTVAAVIAQDLKLPLPDKVLALAYTNDASFAEALARRGARPEQIPEMVARTAALATGSTVLLRADRLAQQSVRVRAGLYAHELTHVAQGRLGRQGAIPLWLLEGHAEWVSRRVLQILELGRYAQDRDDVRRQVVASATPRERFPALQELQTRAAWWDGTTRFGWTPTYGQAFLAVDWLVERHGEERLRLRLNGADLPSLYRDLTEFRAYLHALP